MPELEQDLPFVTRIWFAWACFFRVLFDGRFAGRAFAVRDALPEPAAPPVAPPAPRAPSVPPPSGVGGAGGTGGVGGAGAPREGAALQLLALFQREGRFVDFLEQDIGSFGDAEIGGVARVVHEGCRKALRDHAELVPVRAEEEGVRLTLQAGFDPAQIKLSGNVQGQAPYSGVLRHRGWRAKRLELPVPVKGHDATVIAPAEVEL